MLVPAQCESSWPYVSSSCTSGSLRLCLPDGELRMRSVLQDSPLRPALEGFIQASFRGHFDAHVASFLPELVGFYNVHGEIQAAVGLRSAEQDALFLEQYLDDPIEHVLAERLCIPIDRASIVEVGNLAVARCGIVRAVFQALTVYLAARGSLWIAFTGTQPVLDVFRRMGLAPFRLGSADPRRLEATGDDWGSYYDHEPQVAGGFVPSGLQSVDTSLFDREELRTLLRRVEFWIQ